MTKRKQLLKNTGLSIFYSLLSLFLFSKCMPIDDGIAEAKLRFVDVEEITFEKEGGSIVIKLNSNRDWHVTIGADASWINVNPNKGNQGDAAITIEVEDNEGEVRKGSLTITASTIDKVIAITQNGEDATGTNSSYITTDKDVVTFEKEGGSEAIHISTNIKWSATSNDPWVTIAPENGSNDGMLTVTASKNEGAVRKSTITITNGIIIKPILINQKSKEESTNIASDLFFSEYVEGSSNNKYLEIYNGTDATVDLSDYKIELYVNGQTKVKSTEFLTGALDNEKVVVFKHSKAAIYDGEATVSNTINFNGNDAIALVKISTDAFVDIFGRIGHDPGYKGWTDLNNSDLTTVDKTLVRKPSVRGGVTMNPNKDFQALSSEWITYPMDTADYLGYHTMN